VGDNFPKENEQSLIELCKELGIPIGKISWLNGIPIAQRASIYDPI
jgi:ribosomal protein S12 methylthiotransferase accessory factor YcaO